MAKNENTLTITLKTPANFKHLVQRAMENEWREAGRKWQLSLGEEEKEAVFQGTRRQLESKVSALCKNPWTLEDEALVVGVNSMGRGNAAITLPGEAENSYDVSFVRAKNEWRVCEEPTSDMVPIKDFQGSFFQEIIVWARTGVFYGVASYGK